MASYTIQVASSLLQVASSLLQVASSLLLVASYLPLQWPGTGGLTAAAWPPLVTGAGALWPLARQRNTKYVRINKARSILN